MADDSSMRDVFDRTHAAFHQREEERRLIRATLEPILDTLASAEAKLSELNTFGAEERCRVARARLELLRALRSVERAANTLTEGNHRAAQSFIDHHAR